MSTKNTRRASEVDDDPAPRPLDWSRAVRGKYYDRFQEGTNLVVLAPDLMGAFPDSADFPELTETEILACVAFAADRERKLDTVAA
jgi:hypothetical protein